MKNLKTFNNFVGESYTHDSINEEFELYQLELFVRNIISLPLNFLVFILMNIMSVRRIGDIIPKFLDMYNNMELVIHSISNALSDNTINLTSRERSIARYKLKSYQKLLKKYPDLQSYKNFVKKRIIIYNLKDIDYLRKVVDDYEPRKLTKNELLKLIRVNVKTVEEYHLRKPTPERLKNIDPFGEEEWEENSPFLEEGDYY